MKSYDPNLQIDILAMVDELGTQYPDCVKLQISARDHSAYVVAAGFLNRGGYEVLSVQHEYGIFGGEAGSFLLTLLRAVKMPIVTTMHTVLEAPNEAQRRVTAELLQLSERVIVMSQAAVNILKSKYGLAADRIDLIPHGIPDFSKARHSGIKKSLGISGPMIFTFGLLSPDKGIQFVIEAMPKILAKVPNAKYVVLGASHPNIVQTDGEKYRDQLAGRAKELGVEKSVVFVDRFVSHDELVDYLCDADLYITPYLNPNQITSGTLAYALGANKSVVSTPYLYAQELLGDGRGRLVPFQDAEAIAQAVLEWHSDSLKPAVESGIKNVFVSQLQWPEIGKKYVAACAEALRNGAADLKELSKAPKKHVYFALPTQSTEHLEIMSDDTGIFQHAFHTIPNRSHGYCVDDNARALLLTCLLEGESGLSPKMRQLQSIYLSFVHESFNPDTKKYRNFMSFDRTWLEEEGSDDSHGRTMWALGTVVNRAKSKGHRAAASEIFHLGIPAIYAVNSPRSWAYALLGATELLKSDPQDSVARVLCEQMATRLMREYLLCRRDDWRWFEERATYANPRLSQALIEAGRLIPSPEMVAAGLESLKWLMNVQTSASGQFRPIGCHGFMQKGQAPALYDQQPIEAWASVSACISAFEVTSNPSWIEKAKGAFAWFLGQNDLGQALYDSSTGGCRDGLMVDQLNENQGAESTISFMSALAELNAALTVKALVVQAQVQA